MGGFYTSPSHTDDWSVTLCVQVFCQQEDLHGDDLREFGGLEFPQINYRRCNTKPYRYFYGCGFRHLVGDSLLKMDLKDKTFKVRACSCMRTRSHGRIEWKLASSQCKQ